MHKHVARAKVIGEPWVKGMGQGPPADNQHEYLILCVAKL